MKISLILGENLTYDTHKGLLFNFLFEKSLRYERHETGYRIIEFLKSLTEFGAKKYVG